MDQKPSLLEFAPRLEEALKRLSDVPPGGALPSFDWESFSSLFGSRLGVTGLTFSPGNRLWRKEAPFEGLVDPIRFPIQITPLDGTALLVFSREDALKLASWLLSGTSKGKLRPSEILFEGFSRYLVLEAIDALAQSPLFSSFTPSLGSVELEQEAYYSIEVEARLETKSAWGRLLIGAPMIRSYRRHLAAEPILPHLAESLPLPLSIEIGTVQLTESMWKKVKVGDGLILSRHEPILKLLSLPLFSGKIEGGRLHLTQFASIQEESMSEESPLESIKEIPMTLQLELARIEMPLEKVIRLSYGSIVELPDLSSGLVTLVFQGKAVAKGELVRLGETSALRILEISQ
jgi:type III secretion system YscQ/HrcQ family protein